jgi:hypothetical protein
LENEDIDPMELKTWTSDCLADSPFSSDGKTIRHFVFARKGFFNVWALRFDPAPGKDNANIRQIRVEMPGSAQDEGVHNHQVTRKPGLQNAKRPGQSRALLDE